MRKSEITVESHERRTSIDKAYIEELKQASDNEKRPEITEFENEVFKHAISEEEVFFPASILIGEYLKLKSVIKP